MENKKGLNQYTSGAGNPWPNWAMKPNDSYNGAQYSPKGIIICISNIHILYDYICSLIAVVEEHRTQQPRIHLTEHYYVP